jgi:hypothetical protein
MTRTTRMGKKGWEKCPISPFIEGFAGFPED